ncbi:MAG: cytochrome c biogenesis protein CcsA, partial [Bacteroidales bacterium]|nr:cytochrome c biogenesis protein CcsA [Bacteroidales bacterium]
KGKYASFNDIVDIDGAEGYRLSGYVDNAYQKKPAQRNKFDNEILKVDERVNIVFMVFNRSFMTIFPVPGHENFKWVDPESSQTYLEGDEAAFVHGILTLYLQSVNAAVQTGIWGEADGNLTHIKTYQHKFGGEIMPSVSKVKMEIAYNNYNIFSKLSRYYGMIGFFLLVLYFLHILRPRFRLHWPIRIGIALVAVLFIAHTAGLIIRWYISGHAPWSNGYESMIYIGWATVFAGILFVRRAQIALPATAMLASLILMVAGLSWMDPEITNLVPVLKSYWLVIHVAIITASYGFLALGALLGLISMFIMVVRSAKNAFRLNLVITEITHIIEMTLIIGLFLLTIGTFLGGVWANESWGRYWGWDPKETWALITILVYAFVVHMRYIPGFRGVFPMNFAALISYSSVLMTYFGVNYYLSGLHSYAKGDPVPVPSFVYYSLAVVTVLAVLSFISEKKHGATPAIKGESE